MLKYLVILISLLFLVDTSIGQNPVLINQPYKFNTWITVKDSIRTARGGFDSTLQFPTGCGAPYGIEFLKGGNIKKSAFYYDSCGNKLFIYDPSLLLWIPAASEVTAGNGLTKTGNTFELGGALTKRTPITGLDTSKYITINGLTGFNTSGVFQVVNSYNDIGGSGSSAINGIHNNSGIGVRGLSTNGTGVLGGSNNASGVVGATTNGTAVTAQILGDTLGRPLFIDQRYTTTGSHNRVYDAIQIWRSQGTFPGAGNGTGSRMSFQMSGFDASGQPEPGLGFENHAQIEWKSLDFAGPDRHDELNFNIMADSVLQPGILKLNGKGFATWSKYVGNTYETVDTSFASLVIDPTGKMWKRHGGGGGGGGGASGANPTAAIGLTAVNGVATTFMRSDAAPALDLAIAPTWTGAHTFTGTSSESVPTVGIKNALPQLDLWNTSVASNDQRRWNFTVLGTSNFQLRALADNGSTASGNASIALNIFRNGNQTQDVQIWAMGSMRAKFDGASGVTLSGLAGTGTRMVVANASGILSAQQQTSTIPFISTGTTAPTSTPEKVGDIYIDLSAKKLYFATGTSSSADWTIAN